jgi:hypothetical protein
MGRIARAKTPIVRQPHRMPECAADLQGLPSCALPYLRRFEGEFEGEFQKVHFPSVKKMPERGLEPLLLAEPDPKSGASANFATPASL